MKKLPELKQVKDISLHKDPRLESWLHHFLTENNIEYLQNPDHVASPEQLGFMVALSDDQIYIPCSDETFLNIYHGGTSKEISYEYFRAWRFIVTLIRNYSLDTKTKKRIISFCRLRFAVFLSSRIVLPSRMIKRLVTIVLSQCADPDPFSKKKQQANAKGLESFDNPALIRSLLKCPSTLDACVNIHDMRWELDFVELYRLLLVSTIEELWQTGSEMSALDLDAEFEKACSDCACLRLVFGPEEDARKKILYIPDVSGGFVFDIMIIKNLLRLGHQVVLAVKEGFYFHHPTFWDVQSDPSLVSLLEGAYLINNSSASKNDLLRALREHRFVIISDGTREQINLYHVSTTFARAWKECDVVIAKGRRNFNTLIDTTLSFTRDIVSFWRSEEDGKFHITCKPRAKWVRKFAEKDLISVADEIIGNMRKAHYEGKTVMFYSAIIGSIPGQTKVAITLVNAFVNHLRQKLENTCIINPAEHFVEGMDGDDLMFMWERVQRSGYLNVWRFQTTEDIEQSFTLLDRKVPSVWSGKDSTFSTGCTKEMHIALSVQEQHPELQIIGPGPEKFFRRRDYGVGKYFDSTLRHN